MIYKAIGLMSGSSLDGLDIAYTHYQQSGPKWTYEIIHADCYGYPADWKRRLSAATSLNAAEYCLLHTDFGRYVAEQVNRFIDANALHHKVDLVSSHGHTTFHDPVHHMTAQLGDGAAIAAGTGLSVVSDLRAMDVALGGQGAPIVPIGEKLLLPGYQWLLNLGGIANLSARNGDQYVAFDVGPANRVLNLLAEEVGKEFDEDGRIAASGLIHTGLLDELNALDYYKLPYPKSLANEFGTEVIYPLIRRYVLPVEDALRTYVAHMCVQIGRAVEAVEKEREPASPDARQLLVTGGGALNSFVVMELEDVLKPMNIQVVVPDKKLVLYKEAVVMGLIGVLRWREEVNVLSSVTGAKYDSINGALWLGNV